MLLAGIVGALFAVPLVAVVNVIGEYLAGRDPDDDHLQPSEEQMGPLADESRDSDDETVTEGLVGPETPEENSASQGTVRGSEARPRCRGPAATSPEKPAATACSRSAG